MLAALAICSIMTPALPPVEGSAGFVYAGQPKPCPLPGLTTDYDVAIDFGDGTPPGPGTVQDERIWIVGGVHTYRRAGTYDVKATLTPRTGGAPFALTSKTSIRNAPLTKVSTRRLTLATRRRGAAQTLAIFQDGNRLAEPGDFTARVNWGDRSTKARVVKLAAGRFAVKAARAYRTAGVKRLRLTVADDRGAKLVLSTTASVR